jgi:hypothetical protein
VFKDDDYTKYGENQDEANQRNSIVPGSEEDNTRFLANEGRQIL